MRNAWVRWTLYVLIVASWAGYHGRSVWRRSVDANLNSVSLSLGVTRSMADSWVQQHRAFSSTAAALIGGTNAEGTAQFRRFTDRVAPREQYDGAWLIDPAGRVVASWHATGADSAHTASANDSVSVARCGAGFCAYFGGSLSGRDGGALVLRVPVTGQTFAPINPVRAGLRTARTVLGAMSGDSLFIIAQEGSETVPPVLSRATLAPFIEAAFTGAPARGVSAGLTGKYAIHAATRIAGAPWVMEREIEMQEFAGSYWRAVTISETIVALLLLAVAALAEYWFRARRFRHQQQLATSRSDFVSSVSHELRTPLAQISLFAELLRGGTLRDPDESDRALRIIEKETKRLTILVDNILNFTKLRKRAELAEVEPCDIAEEIELVAEAFAPLAAERQSRVLCESPSARAMVDSLALRQILINFLENAVKYGRRGQVVRIIGEATDKTVCIHVDDEGSGVPVAEREKIWTAFYRRPEAATSSEVGSGIGLSVARDLALQYSGKVSASDAPGGGARFTVEFKRVRRAD